MRQLMFFIRKIEEGLDYIKNYDLDLYNSVLLKLQEIEKSETEDFIINLEKRKILGPIVYDIFEKSNVKLELSSDVYQFSNCAHILTKEKEVTINGKYEIIGHDCFLFSPQVETIIFEDGIKWIDEKSCQNLKNLKTIYLPKTLKKIYSHCFANCTNLENIVFKNTDGYIEPSAFEGTKWFEQIKDEFVIVNNQLLKYNGTSKNIIVPEGVKSINFQVFNENPIIEKVILPTSLEELSVAAFGDCVNLKEVIFEGEKLETIYPMAFDGCINLKEITLPKSIKEIGCEAFSKVTTVICHSNNLEIVDYIKENYPNYKVID